MYHKSIQPTRVYKKPFCRENGQLCTLNMDKIPIASSGTDHNGTYNKRSNASQ